MAKPIKRPWLLKAPWAFKDKLDRIAVERVKKGKDKRTASYSRLALALARSDSVEKELIAADFIEDNRAQFNIFSIFEFMIIAFVCVLFFGGLIWVNGLLYHSLQGVGVLNDQSNAGGACGSYTTQVDCQGDSNCGWSLDSQCVRRTYVNMTQAADQTFGVTNSSIQALRLVAASYIFAMLISILITNSLVKVHPLWFFPYILISILAVLFAVPIANAYESILRSGIYDNGLSSFSAANWVILNLPIVVLFTAFVGAIFMFANIIRGGNEQNIS